MANCTWQYGRVFGDPLAPCGPLNTTNPVAACCAVGDVCLSNSICHTPKSLAGGTSFYIAACSNGGNYTDPRYASICPNRCGNDMLPDVTYLNDSTWACCGTDADGNRDCENPTDEKFVAADKSALVTLWTAGVSTPTSTIVSPTASGTSGASGTPTQTAEQASSSDGGLSTGAKAGIGVGVGVGAVAVILIAVFFVLRRRKHARIANDEKEYHQSAPLSELPQGSPPSELSGWNKASHSRSELQ